MRETRREKPIMQMHYTRRGSGKPLLLIHGLGGSGRSWDTITDSLAARREVIAVDLPGFGETPPLPGEVSIRTLSDAVTDFIETHDLKGVDIVGSSMGARLVLELARRGGGIVGAVISLDPGGFWRGWERHAFYVSIYLSIRLVRLLQPLMPLITGNPIGRTLLFSQFSAHPWTLSPKVTLEEMRNYAASPSFDELLYNLAYGEPQQGSPPNSISNPLVIGWGDKDWVCFPPQAERAQAMFPDAQLHWFNNCGHFPHWDSPQEATQVVLDGTLGRSVANMLPEVTHQSERKPNIAAAVLVGTAIAFGLLWLTSDAFHNRSRFSRKKKIDKL